MDFEAPGTFVSDFEALAKLLAPPQDQRDERQERERHAGAAGPHPGSIGPSERLDVTVAAPRGSRVEAAAQQAGGRPAAVVDAADAAADAAIERDDGREVPSYELLYKQAVGTHDAFLGMSGKDPSSACCEELVLRIALPEAAGAAELDLDMQPTKLQLTSQHYKLLVHLPRKVDADRGRARWDGAKRVLTVTARIAPDDAFA